MLALGFWFMGELKYLSPYKRFLIHEYGHLILIYLATLFLNVFAIALALNRKFFLKDTGRKLSHLDLHEAKAPDVARMRALSRGTMYGTFVALVLRSSASSTKSEENPTGFGPPNFGPLASSANSVPFPSTTSRSSAMEVIRNAPALTSEISSDRVSSPRSRFLTRKHVLAGCSP